jgi:CRISPR/Cas system-associated protein Cas10 (large subunit of type III CRISPR-Cas system)
MDERKVARSHYTQCRPTLTSGGENGFRRGRFKKTTRKRKMAQKFLSGPFFIILVRLAGIEPTTPWFVAKYSIQLSYSRDRKEYISFERNGKAAFYD